MIEMSSCQLRPLWVKPWRRVTGVTAARQPRLQAVGANQPIAQQNLYGPGVRGFFDPGPPFEIPGAGRVWRRLGARAVAEAAGGPVHTNLPFREPLVPPPGQA